MYIHNSLQKLDADQEFETLKLNYRNRILFRIRLTVSGLNPK